MVRREGVVASDLWLAMAICLAVFWPICLVMVLVFKVRVDDKSIRGQDPFGRSIRLDWQSIDGVTLFRVPGLPFYRVTSKGDQPEMWLPGFMKKPASFAAAVEDRAGPDHPLTEFLRERVGPAEQ